MTAHNLEDQVETFFIRLSRGSGLTGLSSMRFLSHLSDKTLLARPLLDVKKRYLISISKKLLENILKTHQIQVKDIYDQELELCKNLF